jgi:hypothetical protein
MELINSKSILAKLMATENLTVEQRAVRTAFFDVENRILTVPILDNKISSQLYDLFMGHEVGHALYTPADDLRTNLNDGVDRTIINVVEDSRIERKIKQKYPGLSKSFVKGYTELVERDFFETNNKNLNDMNLIDRINIHCKGGPGQGIKFNGVERYLLDKVENTQTFEDVIEVSKEIVEYMKKEQEEKEKRKQEAQQKQNPEVEPIDEDIPVENSAFDNQEEQEKDEPKSSGFPKDKESDKKEDSEENLQQNSEKSDSKEEKNDKNENEAETENDSEQGHDNKGVQDELKAHTDEAFRKNESKLFDTKAKEFVYANIPDMDPKKIIFDYKDLYAIYKKGSSDGRQYFSSKKDFNIIRQESSKVVSYLVKEFELRKNADQMKKASMAKTGDLNMSKIFSYQFNEDIFKKISITPNGKSHGLIMILDWSGSMSNHIKNTMKQLFNLVLFCKKVNIPYEVYAFSVDAPENYLVKLTPKKDDLALSHFSMMNILSSRMSASEFMYAGAVLCGLSKIGYTEGETNCWWTTLSSTPLNQAIIAAMKIVPEFQKKNKLQIVNTVFLTDGESDCVQGVYAATKDFMDREYLSEKGLYGLETLVIRDPKTKHQVSIKDCYHGSNVTSGLIKLFKSTTNSNVVGFYILAGNEFSRKVLRFNEKLSNDELVKMTSEFRKNNYSIVTSAGFDEYYLLRSQGMIIDDGELEVKENATTRGLVSAFTKYTGNKLNNRIVLNRFINLIA